MQLRSLFAAALACTALAMPAWADEGMWTFDNFPADRMRARYGWAPDQAWLDHVRLASLRLAQGCSASFVSPDGLVMTNHHCARECIAALSTPQHDYIAHGFYATKPEDERACPELEANQLLQITDVTKRCQAATEGKEGSAFHDAERGAIAAVEKACTTGADVRCQVVTLYQGGVYDLYKYRRYQDLRLVWAVEDSGANFGGDPDNFNYPRYAIDASYLRVYEHGKPLHTEQHLKFSASGVKEGDITLTSGNPGTTEREETISQLRLARDIRLPFLIDLFSELRGVLWEYGSKGPEQQRTSLTDLFYTENSLKAFKGMVGTLTEGPLMRTKEAAEADLRQQVAADPRLAQRYGGAWDAIAQAVQRGRTILYRYTLLERLPGRFSNLFLEAVELNRYAAEQTKPDAERLEEYSDSNFPALRQSITSEAPVYRELEKTKLTWMLLKIREWLGADDPDVHAILGRESPEQIAARIVDGTRLTDPKLRAKLLQDGPAAIAASQDPLLVFVRRFDGPARAVRKTYEDEVKAPITKNATLVAKARFALHGTSIYPDATFTARLSYGAVDGYMQDGKRIPPFTSFGGAFARATGNDPFRLPESWMRAKDAIDPNTPLDMVTTNDIVGGNSGSPVIDRRGDAVGLVFDGNIQSLGGDFGYDPAVNRAVAVDIVGLRMALDKIYHAGRLVKELAQ